MILKSLKRINLRKTILNYIFLIFICIATIFFINNVTKYGNNFEYNLKYLILFILLYIVSHIFRFIRFFIIYIEEKKNLKELINVYLSYTYVNYFIPFKLGDLFKILEISYMLDNFGKGFIGTWIDRFFDTLILTFILIFGIGLKQVVSYKLLFYLSSFLFFSVFCYLCFRYTYLYANRIILTKSETRK